MISTYRKTIDHIKIEFDKNFVDSLSILSKRKIEPITVNIENKDIIIGLKCPVIMDGDTFERDKKTIESDILKTFASILNSEICNREQEKNHTKVRKRRSRHISFPCPVCGSTNTIADGHRETKVGLKEKRSCKQCGKHYTNQEDAIWKMKNQRQVIEDALKLGEYFSLRDTARQIKEKYKIEISHSAIHCWRKNKRFEYMYKK